MSTSDETAAPAPAPPAGQWPWTEPARPVAALGLSVLVLLGVQFAAGIATLVAAIRQHSLIADAIADPGSVSVADAESSDQLLDALSTTLLVLYLGTGIVWLVWFYRARTNVEAWDPQYQRRAPGWAIGAWFIPVVNLVLPVMITNDVLADSERVPGEYRTQRPVSQTVVFWGLAHAATAVAALYLRGKSTELDGYDATPADFTSYATASIVWVVLTLIALVFAFLVVRRITVEQRAKIAGVTPSAA